MLRRVAEANRLLVEGRRTIDRQRDIIARLERMGIDSTKQHALLTLLEQIPLEFTHSPRA